ncbi:hypothetical protein C7E25_00930 [Stenotrophomonas maltophilia]|uniref:DUF4189 domain-containing protein n=1 Tax=Stenotrophomonas geniculata TaxID=86188 RepID=UPI000D4BBE23|nr:DUF4189 domain-containing protein [Stenotrophomonas geniculata]PSD44442.1 hypothetical protein C7E24_21680 [Stenotrophomonas maltophilia]PSD51011.1 hypothetical protein C7E25_00930 [Stenotrophomonas maltophilia]PWQ87935.1 hypothetical protein DKY64_01460 [Stenotrophomonas maltophilia]
MKLIAHWVLLASCLLLLGGVDRAWAEGNCPPGYYPIGGQGARGCAPIPGGATGSTGSSEIRLATPTGKWTKTWGAIAESKSTQDAGVSTGLRSKNEAEREAVSKCGASGARDCTVSMSYFNQCISWVIPSGRSGAGRAGLGTGATPELALVASEAMCRNDRAGRCEVFYSNCTKPLFDEF